MCVPVPLQSGDLPGFSPLMFLPIMCLPYLVLWLSLSWWWVIPLSFLYLSYLHNIKTRHENRRYVTPSFASDLLSRRHLVFASPIPYQDAIPSLTPANLLPLPPSLPLFLPSNSAMSVATDPGVIKLINQHLPPWFFDADLERTQWLSHVLQKLWNSVSGTTHPNRPGPHTGISVTLLGFPATHTQTPPRHLSHTVPLLVSRSRPLFL